MVSQFQKELRRNSEIGGCGGLPHAQLLCAWEPHGESKISLRSAFVRQGQEIVSEAHSL